MSNWSWPQIVMLCLMVAECVLVIPLDGTPRKPWSMTDKWAGMAILAFILGWGGFWK